MHVGHTKKKRHLEIVQYIVYIYIYFTRSLTILSVLKYFVQATQINENLSSLTIYVQIYK